LHRVPGKTEVSGDYGRASEVTAFKLPDEIRQHRRDDAESEKIKSHHDKDENKCGVARIRGER
jgi:hypothetical protein